MNSQPLADVQTNPATNRELTQRVIQLEAALAELQAVVNKFLHPFVDLNYVNGVNGIDSNAHDLQESSHDDPNDLVPIRMLTEPDMRERLNELEAQYNMDSQEFYGLWKQGEVDHIPEKMGWSILYEDWLQTQPTLNSI
ncbi:MAG: hypothetical protein AAF702_07805 [Chloroflexota bacterium]